MSKWRWAILSAVASVVGGAGVAAQAPAAGGLVRYWMHQLEALARPDGRHGTLGPTGPRLWATRLQPAPGFRGQLHYLHHTPELVDPMVVDFTDGGSLPLVLEVRAQQWQPSHGTVRYAIAGHPGGEVLEERWITGQDVLVARFSVSGVRRFGVRWHSPLAEQPGGSADRFHAVSLARHANADLLRSKQLRRGGDLAPVFWEGEDYSRQVGSTGTDKKAAASGGEVLGRDFGSTKGHEVAYPFVATGVGRWTLVARYARMAAGAAAFAVAIDGRPVGVLKCPPTGGWGEREAQLALARLELGEISAGRREIALTATADGSNTNFDGFFLLPSEHAVPLPPRQQWSQLDRLRGAVVLPGGRLLVDGVPFAFLPPMGPQGVYRPDEPIPVPGTGSRLHVLAVPTGPDAWVSCGEDRRELGARRPLRDLPVVLDVADRGELALRTHDCVVLAVTREVLAGSATSHSRRGRARFWGVDTEVLLGLHGLARPWSAEVAEGGSRVFHVTLELTGQRLLGAGTEQALAGDDTLLEHRRRYAAWFAANAPRLRIADPLLSRCWTYRWFLVRHNLAEPGRGFLSRGPVVFEGRHGSWYPRVISFSTPHIVAEARWLADPRYAMGNVEALLDAQDQNGVLRNVLIGWQGFRYTNWVPEAAVGAFKVHPDRDLLRRLLPGLVRNVEGNAAQFDRDRDGLLSPGDHYTTGMEFQPAFWALQGYDNTKPQTELERPDFNAYHYGNAMALAEAARELGDSDLATRMEQLAATTREAVLGKLWSDGDRFFYSVREADDAIVRCREVVGFYPFRFGLVPPEPRYLEALRALVDSEQFWTPFPVASCSKQVPVYSAAVQRWPGPGGKVTACMWNGPTWPHADSLIADAMAAALRTGKSPLHPHQLGQLLQRFALLHCEKGDPNKLLLREYANGDTGEGWGCPDYMHSTFNDLLIRHAAGLQPRFDNVIDVRPLDLGLGDLAIEDIPYHGHHLTIAIQGDHLRVSADGHLLGEASARTGLHATL